MNYLYRNIANITSILGVLPLAVLYLDNGYQYLIPLILFNNAMDDLDGIFAEKLNIRSRFGANLDNVCDAVAHVAITLAVGIHFEGSVLVISAIASTAIILRATSRLDPDAPSGGSPTNELMRHLLFTLLLSSILGFDPEYLLIVVFLLNTASMLSPFTMTAMLRSQAKTATLVILVNLVLIAAWQIPETTLFIAISFFVTYLYSFAVGGMSWVKAQSTQS